MNTIDTFNPLPALKSLGSLSELRPVVIVDTREQEPLVFTRLQSVVRSLDSGDYSFAGGEHLFSIERKSISDLVTCCAGERPRFERELVRLRGYRFKRLLIVGDRRDVELGRYRSNMKPKAVLSTLSAIEARYDCPVVWAGTPAQAAELVESWVYWYAREICRTANELLRGTRDNSQPE